MNMNRTQKSQCSYKKNITLMQFCSNVTRLQT